MYRRLRHTPWSLILPALLLVGIGLAAVARCDELAGSNGRFFYRQIVWCEVALLFFLATALPSHRHFCRHAYTVYGGSIVLLLLVYLFPPINGAHRWIRLGPVGLQPSELAKVACVIVLARYLRDRDQLRRAPGVVGPVLLALIPALLILREPDLGTATVLFPVLLVMLFVAGTPVKSLAALVLVAVGLLPVLWTQMSLEQRSRVTALFHQAGPGETDDDEAYQLRQAKQMVALGGVWGSFWLGEAVDDPAAYRLPEAHSDFVFSVIGERFGLPGMAAVLALFAWLVAQSVAVGHRTRDPFARMLAFGVAALLAVQVVINTGMSVGLLPITGLPLPLVSYGGSGLMTQGIALGLLVNVAVRPGYDITPEPFQSFEQ
ncbi:MAG: rod shape-determining protein RodA [Planctomycetaceae bacterium]|mgnify:CR=1 FL=1|jgi:cell division protein FtsW (lipid II flippase)|nr:rod shape-determining protein RodA [Planctomycetaceae bacterium]